MAACAPVAGPNDPPESSAAGIPVAGENDAPRIRIAGANGEEVFSFSESDLKELRIEPFAGIYSTINNWPTARFYAAEGYPVIDILKAAGLADTFQTVIFRAGDGYETALTKEQLLSPQFFFPRPGEDGDGAEPVFPVIAYRLREGSDDIAAIRDDDPYLIIGQRNAFEHTNPAFVVGVTEILTDDSPCEVWPEAGVFPAPGPIAPGETVKLQHPDFGLVKLHYTIDGSTPTLLSPMYNPSTYRPELNKPITITEPTVIKAIASGYGKQDSGVAVFEFIPVVYTVSR